MQWCSLAWPQNCGAPSPCPPACTSHALHAQPPTHPSPCKQSLNKLPLGSLIAAATSLGNTPKWASWRCSGGGNNTVSCLPSLSTPPLHFKNGSIIQVSQLAEQSNYSLAIILYFGYHWVATQVQATQVWKLLEQIENIRVIQLVVLQVQGL